MKELGFECCSKSVDHRVIDSEFPEPGLAGPTSLTCQGGTSQPH